MGLFVYHNTNIYGGVVSELFLIPAVYFPAQISAKRYQFFFNNSGFSQTRIFFLTGLIHFAAFLIFTGILTWFHNA